nr:hypothetical protein [Candidatus Enterovibrio escacola]
MGIIAYSFQPNKSNFKIIQLDKQRHSSFKIHRYYILSRHQILYKHR